MPDEKICPIMSGPQVAITSERANQLILNNAQLLVPCQRERCMAWAGEILETNEGKAYGRIVKSEGYCKLIKRQL